MQIERFRKLKAIIRCGIGYDIIDINYAKQRHITVSNVPDYCIQEVADTTLAYILNIVRGINRLDCISRKTREGWQENLIDSIRRSSEQTIGIIGAGNIGSCVIRKLSFLGFPCVYYDRFLDKTKEKKIRARRLESLDELLSLSDLVSLHVPLTPLTHGMINDAFLKKMKPGASLINTARGKIVFNMKCIYTNLKSGHLLNVAFDVLPEEPPENESLIKAWREQEAWLEGRLIVNPHAAFYSVEAVHEVRRKAALNAKGILSGKKPINVVNF